MHSLTNQRTKASAFTPYYDDPCPKGIKIAIYLVKVSTPALAEALGETKPEPHRVYVVVMERKTPPAKRESIIYHTQITMI